MFANLLLVYPGPATPARPTTFDPAPWYIFGQPTVSVAKTVPYPDPDRPIVRDWDVLQVIIGMLKATNAFSGVYASDMPESYGRGSDRSAIAIVSPDGFDESDGGWDDPGETQWVHKATWQLAVIVRDPDPMRRDRKAERLVNVAKRAIDADTSLGGACLIGMTHIDKAKYLKATPPTRVVVASGTFAYLIDGPESYAIEP